MDVKSVLLSGFIAGALLVGGLYLYNQRPKELVLFPGICVQEINKQYVAASGEPDRIYKVDSIQLDGVNVRIYTPQDKSWTYLDKRPLDYFVQGNVFRYENVGCPDASAKETASLNNRLRAMKFELGKTQEKNQVLDDSSYVKKRDK